MTGSQRVILASAGTGKTFQLSHRYIGLLAEGAAPEQILATTFTRKAAGEILERILTRLAEGALDDSVAAELGSILGRPDVTAAQCLDWLALLVSRLDRLQVRTLDSFFVHLATLFGNELGLPPGWRLADEGDDARLRDEAVAAMTAAMEPAEAAALIRDLKSGGEGLTRSTHEALRDRVVKDAYSLHRVAQPGAWERYSAPPAISEDELERAMDALERAELPLTKAGQPSKRYEGARDSVLQAVRGGDWEGFVRKGWGKAVLVSDGLFYKKPLQDDVVEALRPMLAQASHELLRSLVTLNRSYGTLLERYGVAERSAKIRHRRQGFADIPEALRAGPAVDSAVMAHRLDGRVQHLLLDEFQDTSVQQWQVLEPLARRLVEPGQEQRSFFCVGDVKQSIYAWRGGESRLLAQLSEHLQLGKAQTMVESRRSSSVVLDVVNRIFSAVSTSSVFDDEPDRVAAAERWQEGFEEHQAHDSKAAGHAALWEVPSDGESTDERVDDVIAAAAEHIRRMVARAPRISVGVLVRRKKIATRIIAALRDRGVAASGEGGMPLTDCAAVRLALSALQLADHPGDTAAAFHLAHSPLAEVLGLSDPKDSAARRALSLRVRRALLSKGYGAWLAELAGHVEQRPEFSERDRRRLGQLVDLGLSAGPGAGLRPAEFCRRARLLSVEDAAAAAVRVMTIHSSKGLEFDAVVLPDLDGDLAKAPKLMVSQPDPWQGPRMLMAGLREDLLPLDERLAALSGETWGRAIEESLCVLYVALTRAARSLDLFVLKPAEPKKGASVKRTFATIVREALSGAGDPASAGVASAAGDAADVGAAGAEVSRELTPAWWHPASDSRWWVESSGGARAVAAESPEGVAALSGPASVGARSTAAESSTEPLSVRPVSAVGDPVSSGPITLRPSTRPRFLSRRAPSAAEGGGKVMARDLLASTNAAALTRGSAVHLWFEQIEWLDDFALDDETLLALARRQLGDHLELCRWLEQWRSWLHSEATVSLLSRPAEVPEVWRERSFLLPVSAEDGARQLLGGSFDRVHVLQRDGEPMSVTVIDFKSDAIPDEATLQERKVRYAPQLAEYRLAASQLTGLDAGEVRCVLLFAAAARAVEV